MRDAIFAFPEFGLILLHVIVLGGCAVRFSGFSLRDRWAFFAVVPAVGLSVFGAELFVVGELRLLTRAAIYISSVVVLLLGWIAKPLSVRPPESMQVSEGIRDERVARRLMELLAAMVLLIVVIACFRPAVVADEIDYHWPTPLLWAHNHGWTWSPYRLSNATALAEMLFTVAALFNNPTVAHFTEAMSIPIVFAAVGSLAKSVGASPWAAALAALSIPVFLAYGVGALNDGLVAAFLITAYAVLLGGAESVPRAPALLLTTVLVLAAISTKPFAICAVPGIAAYLIYCGFRKTSSPAERRRLLFGLTGMSLMIAATFALWSLHCYLRAGKWWETNGMYMATSPADPLWNTPYPAGRHPRLIDVLTTPFVFPIVSTFNRENYWSGYRTGPLLLIFCPLAVFNLKRLSIDHKTRLYFLLAGAAIFLLLFSPISSRTRFHLFVWFAGCVAAAIGLDWTQHFAHRWQRQGAIGLFFLLCLVGVLDASRHLFAFGQNVLH